jgi:hypothetical protein
MTLSEAIRLGAMLKPKGSNSLFRAGHTCALGAALDACGALWSGREEVESDMDEVTRRWPICGTRVAWPVADDLPCFGQEAVGSIVTELNDTWGWTREQIADWVATIEAQIEQATEQPQPVSVEV